MKQFLVAIPSTGRADTLISRTSILDFIPQDMMKDVYLFVRQDEDESYNKVFEKYGCTIISLPCLSTDMEIGIVETRDWILEYCYRKDVQHLFMIDDDTKLAQRDPNSPKEIKAKYIKMGHEGFREMVNTISSRLGSDFPLCGISTRAFNHDKPEINYNIRIVQFAAIHVPTFYKEKIKYSDAGIRYMTDYYVAILLLLKGYQNICFNTYTRDEVPNSAGGCTIRRTVKLQNLSAIGLFRMFPDIVKPFAKQSKGWTEPRVNVRIAWKKARKIGESLE